MQSKTIYGLMLIILVAATLQTSVAQKPATTQSQTSKAKPKQTVTAAATAALVSTREQETIDEINLARADPAAYLKFLEQFRKNYRGKQIHFPDGSVLVTSEGVAPLDEAIAFMRTLKPVPPLVLHDGMVLAAKDHLNDMVKTGRSGHKGSDGSIVNDRLNRYGRWEDSVGEDIVYFSRSAREDVIALIIDDGVSNRGHRKNIFKTTFHAIGIARSQPMKPGTLCVITFAGGFKDKATSDKKTNTPSPILY